MPEARTDAFALLRLGLIDISLVALGAIQKDRTVALSSIRGLVVARNVQFLIQQPLRLNLRIEEDYDKNRPTT